jgi:hypothetical protein
MYFYINIIFNIAHNHDLRLLLFLKFLTERDYTTFISRVSFRFRSQFYINITPNVQWFLKLFNTICKRGKNSKLIHKMIQKFSKRNLILHTTLSLSEIC